MNDSTLVRREKRSIEIKSRGRNGSFIIHISGRMSFGGIKGRRNLGVSRNSF
jgi:hypothetical protein